MFSQMAAIFIWGVWEVSCGVVVACPRSPNSESKTSSSEPRRDSQFIFPFKEWGLTEPETDNRSNGPDCIPPAGPEVLGMTVTFEQKGPANPLTLSTSHTPSVYLEGRQKESLGKGLSPFLLKVGEKHLLKLPLLSTFRPWFVKPGLEKALNQSKMDLHL